eukprot:TRINITY_DN37509_c0_g1_i1.p1 TRINITY_DN37509_c0_g1~~TRINITY_DN37509_c0_g1_i1.p1  ORF type:complete len:290 (+),score=73.88 TRINITY_DN37509_c0_g1_i1:50-871(+)
MSGRTLSPEARPDPVKKVSWSDPLSLAKRSNYSHMMSRTMVQGLVRVYYGKLMANGQLKKLERKNESLQRMLGDGSQLLDSKVKILTEELNRKTDKIKDLKKQLATSKTKHKAALSSKREAANEANTMTASLEAVIQQKNNKIFDLEKELERASLAILDGAEQYHAVSTDLQDARSTLFNAAQFKSTRQPSPSETSSAVLDSCDVEHHLRHLIRSKQGLAVQKQADQNPSAEQHLLDSILHHIQLQKLSRPNTDELGLLQDTLRSLISSQRHT